MSRTNRAARQRLTTQQHVISSIDPEVIRQFLRQAAQDEDISADLRRIGTDNDMVQAIIERIASREKTMTYSLPWIAEREGRNPPCAGQHLLALDAKDQPALLLRLEQVRTLKFGDVSERDIQREGIPMRDLAAWRPLHIAVWNQKLAPYNLQVNDDMPVWAEDFELVYSAR